MLTISPHQECQVVLQMLDTAQHGRSQTDSAEQFHTFMNRERRHGSITNLDPVRQTSCGMPSCSRKDCSCRPFLVIRSDGESGNDHPASMATSAHSETCHWVGRRQNLSHLAERFHQFKGKEVQPRSDHSTMNPDISFFRRNHKTRFFSPAQFAINSRRKSRSHRRLWKFHRKYLPISYKSSNQSSLCKLTRCPFQPSAIQFQFRQIG